MLRITSRPYSVQEHGRLGLLPKPRHTSAVSGNKLKFRGACKGTNLEKAIGMQDVVNS